MSRSRSLDVVTAGAPPPNPAELLESHAMSAHDVDDLALMGATVCLASAVAISIWGVLRPKAFADISADEIMTYTSRPFLTETDLWRVHVRSLFALHYVVSDVRTATQFAAEAVARSLVAFLAGLALSLLAIATLLADLL